MLDLWDRRLHHSFEEAEGLIWDGMREGALADACASRDASLSAAGPEKEMCWHHGNSPCDWWWWERLWHRSSRPCCYFEWAKRSGALRSVLRQHACGLNRMAYFRSQLSCLMTKYVTWRWGSGQGLQLPSQTSLWGAAASPSLLFFPFIISRNEKTTGMPQEGGRWPWQALGNLCH